jgi:hypothetical protein
MPEDTVAAAFEQVDRGDVPPTVDQAALDRMRTVARLLDELVTVPGTDFKIGLDPVVGAIPVVGSALSAGVSLYIVAESARLGVSYGTLMRMLANVSVDTVGSSIPIVGALFDSLWKANKWNVAMALADLSQRRLDEERAVEIEVQ